MKEKFKQFLSDYYVAVVSFSLMIVFFAVWFSFANPDRTIIGDDVHVVGDLTVDGQMPLAVPSDIKNTTATHSGNFEGYQAMHDWIQANGCAGYYVCSPQDIHAWTSRKGEDVHLSLDQNSWVVTHAVGPTTRRDCDGWTTSSSDRHGEMRSSTHSNPNLSACSSSRAVMCCKY